MLDAGQKEVLTRISGVGAKEKMLRIAACKALRAWLHLDNPELPPEERKRLTSRARLLTGRAIDLGLLRTTDTEDGEVRRILAKLPDGNRLEVLFK